MAQGTAQERTSRENMARSEKCGLDVCEGDFQTMVEEIGTSVQRYSGKHPAVVAGMIFFAGFYLGWKIKPW